MASGSLRGGSRLLSSNLRVGLQLGVGISSCVPSRSKLTLFALLFAVYRVRTVPFYVFDEVEAALDDSNLSKLLDAIEQLKETTQLIVISHQRRTMEQADVLYGVSMQADGVSHVVSQRLDQATGKVVDA